MELLNSMVDSINTLLWSYVLIVVLVGCGIYFTFATKFVQLRLLPEMIRLLTLAAGENYLKSGLYREFISGKLAVNKGMMTENLVAQMLTASRHPLRFFEKTERQAPQKAS